jgi:hypothetical protein
MEILEFLDNFVQILNDLQYFTFVLLINHEILQLSVKGYDHDVKKEKDSNLNVVIKL